MAASTANAGYIRPAQPVASPSCPTRSPADLNGLLRSRVHSRAFTDIELLLDVAGGPASHPQPTGHWCMAIIVDYSLDKQALAC